MSAEIPVMRRGWLKLASFGMWWRLNTGKAWVSGAGPVQRLTDGSVRVPAARPIAVGLGLINGDPVVGASDLIGGTLIRITPAMVGQVVPVLSMAEAKKTTGGRVSKEQRHVIDMITEAGGIAGVFTSPEEAEAIILDWCKKTGAELP